jgi:hypothetical protein
VYLITLIDINDSLGQMTDNEDHDHPREEGYHGLVPPVHEEHDDMIVVMMITSEKSISCYEPLCSSSWSELSDSV